MLEVHRESGGFTPWNFVIPLGATTFHWGGHEGMPKKPRYLKWKAVYLFL